MLGKLRALSAAAFLSSACGGDGTPFTPTVENVAGNYEAATLTVTEAGFTADLLSIGASLTMSLEPDGTTSGRLFAPGFGTGGSDLDADLSGTWTLTGSIVTFDQPGDTFVRDVPFTVERNRLIGEGTFSGVAVRTVLRKVGG
jgi:hypothetical protein